MKMIGSILLAAIFLGDHTKGEIEIVTDPVVVESIAMSQKNRWVLKGYSEEQAAEMSRMGVVAEDSYWIWKRDPVIFPSGARGSYNRLYWRNSEEGKPIGVAVLPVLPDGSFALNVNFRHATRSWELELPRGMIQKGEGCEDAARRELEEETGLRVRQLLPLGTVAPDSGVLSSLVPVYAGLVGERGESRPEESEAISGIALFTLDEIQAALKKGFIETAEQGRVYVRDSFLTYALFQYLYFSSDRESSSN